ncbi:MAG: citryl-CoA lyase [Bacillota bacterium]
MGEKAWTTSITKVEPNKLSVRGYRLDELMGRLSFAETIYLILIGDLPEPAVAKVIDALLVSSIDHGATPPSALAARTAASTGASLSAALAAGVLSINKFHGGAIEGCMKFLHAAVDKKHSSGKAAGEIALELVRSARQAGERLPGYGHRIHTNDPRTGKLISLAQEAGIAAEYVDMAQAVQASIRQETGKELPLNIDGAIAALLCELKFPAELANGLFLIARMPGLIAHVYEEMTTQLPMRRISPTAHEYVGPVNRELARKPGGS